ncbi:MAG TPA: metallophosphoesterase [Ktedonobacteraceae bacterium]|nr:metallophosphoesterase [Ktedonobacteraceae bacterium]
MPLFRTHKQRPAFQQIAHATKSSPRFIPIPNPQPANCTLPLSAILGSDEVKTIQDAGNIVFHAVGDTGGYNGTDTQEAVAEAMEAQFNTDAANTAPSFFYHLGDVIYYNGQSSLYEAQFYEPYKYYPQVIFAIPGNHDGDTLVRRGDPPDTEPSLYGFFENFCAPQRTPISTYRDAMTQPYVYWTLQAPFVTIIGLYGNVDGTLDGQGTVTQQQWLTTQLQSADPSTCIIVAVHQPPFSLDKTHGGYPSITDAIDQAAHAAEVWPHAVFSGHVHNYQRFTRTATIGDQQRSIPYLVAGAGGYANSTRQMHKLRRDAAKDPVPCPSPTSDPQVELRGYNEIAAGFLRITVTKAELTAEYFTVPFTGSVPTTPFDAITLNYQTGTITNEMNPGTSGAEVI